jgi:hypothetical protein
VKAVSRKNEARKASRVIKQKGSKKVNRETSSRVKKQETSTRLKSARKVKKYNKVEEDNFAIKLKPQLSTRSAKIFHDIFADDIYSMIKNKDSEYEITFHFIDASQNSNETLKRLKLLFSDDTVCEVYKLPIIQPSHTYKKVISYKRKSINDPIGFIDNFIWRLRPAPVELNSENDENIEFDLNSLPKLLSQYIDAGAKSLNAPAEYIAVSLIVMVGMLCSHKLHLQPKEDPFFIVNSNLWGMSVGLPGSKKTPASEYALRLLDPLIEKSDLSFNEQSSKFDALKEESELKLALAKRDARKLLDELEESVCPDERDELRQSALSRLEKAFANVPDLIRKRYKTSNVTLTELHNLLTANPLGILLAVDEINGLLSHLYKKGNEDLKAYLLECYSGFGSHDFDRATTKHKPGRNLALSIYGTIQPDKLNVFLKKVLYGNEDNDGWLNRFQIIVCCTEHVSSSNTSYVAAPEVVNAMQNFVLALDKENFGFNESTPINSRNIRFSTSAQNTYLSWWSVMSKKYDNESIHPVFIAHIRKYESLVPTLALIFQIVLAYSVKRKKFRPVCEVTDKALLLAIEFTTFLESHAKRIFDPTQMVSKQNAELIFERRDDLPKSFTARDISQKNWAGLGRSSELTRDALELLENHFIIWRIPTKTCGKTSKYKFNPKLNN